MSVLQSLSVRAKIYLLLAVPLLAVAFFAVHGVLQKQRTASDMEAVLALSELSVHASALVHETQKERGMTAGFLGSKGTAFSDVLPRQRAAVDGRIAELETFLAGFDAAAHGAALVERLDEVKGGLERRAETRRAVDALAVETPKAIGYYTGLNRLLLGLVDDATRLTADGAITRMLGAYGYFLQAKERAGIERAVLSNTFAADRFGPGMFRRFGELVAAQETYLAAFRTLARPDAVAFLDDTMRDPSVQQVEAMRDIAFERAASGGFGVDAAAWFKTITAKIDLAKAVEDHLATTLREQVGIRADAARAGLTWFAVLAAASLLVAIGLGVAIARGITEALNATLTALDEIAAGDGDLTRRLAVSGRDEIAALAVAFNGFAEKVRQMLLGIRESAQRIGDSAGAIAAGNSELNGRTVDQAASLEETAASMEQMTATVRQNADNAREASALVSGAREQARSGGEVMHHAVAAMSEISSASRRIADIIAVIDEIAFQTNLLALNAAVEAARAGEQGRGFAVVAGEVRNLAQRSAGAAKEIKTLIEDSLARVEDGARLVGDSGRQLEAIVDRVSKVTDIVTEISTASQEQTSGIDQVNEAVMHLDSVTQRNAAMVEEATAASKAMEEEARDLMRLVGAFELGEAAAGRAAPARPRPQATSPRTTRAATPADAEPPAPLPPTRAPTRRAKDEEDWDEF
ncbi:MAG: nitrate- and nitrite sensing domain-containing protein [Ectothiorhodospiraceae bacterium]|nr:nitrate- and nitrite sensing domain-containing protein [Chromatiales bacterium]MCP5155483.1 nitrate- and nitrite sensing domain-containing protein [Ectothiorhodospiraceae bacterium]